jgi:hypothetical protein
MKLDLSRLSSPSPSPGSTVSASSRFSAKSGASEENLPQRHTLVLRDSGLTSLATVSLPSAVRSLDLSFNMLSGLDILSPLPHLRQLYLSHNCIDSLMDFPLFSELQVLSLAHNALTSLDGLPLLPNLVFLDLSGNNLASFGGLPRFPQLAGLNLSGNPVCAVESYRKLAIGMSSSSLNRVDGIPVTDEERAAAAKLVDAKTAVALREGIDVHLNGDIDQFLLGLQREQESEGLRVHYVGLVGRVMEGEIVSAQAVISSSQVAILPTCMRLLPIEGNGSIALNFSNPSIPYAIQDRVYVSPGTYTVNGQTIVVSAEQKGDVTQIRGKAAIISVSWFRSQNGDFVEIEADKNGDNPPQYRVAKGDIGENIMFELTTFISEPIMAFAISPRVDAAPPTITDVVVPQMIEGVECTVSYTYYGGFEGKTIISWLVNGSQVHEGLSFVPSLPHVGKDVLLRITPVSTENQQGRIVETQCPSVKPGAPTVRNVRVDVQSLVEGCTPVVTYDYFGGVEDGTVVDISPVTIGQPVTVKITARNMVGDVGVPVEFTTPQLVVAAAPRVVSSKLITETEGVFREGETITVSYVYFGGVEGQSRLTWKSCVPSFEDIGKVLTCTIVPVRLDGEEGAPVELTTGTIERGLPTIVAAQVAGSLKQGSEAAVSFTYRGGVQGVCRVQWSNGCCDPCVLLGADDVDKDLTVTVTPVRDDGVVGTPFTVSAGKVQYADPEIYESSIVGTVEEGSSLEAKWVYYGGPEGSTRVEWRVDGECVGTERTLYLANSFVGKFVELCLTPVRADGMEGAVFSIKTEQEVAKLKPVIKNLRFIVGATVEESQEVAYAYEYLGGEQGATEVEWLRLINGELQQIAVGPKYCVTKSDIGQFIAIMITPVNKEGERGEAVQLLLNSEVVAAAPQLVNPRWEEPLIEGTAPVLVANYLGGNEGASLLGDIPSVLALQHVGHPLSVSYTPVRDDGVNGTPVTITSSQVVQAGHPSVSNLAIGVVGGGELKEREDLELSVTAVYFGGREGQSRICWFRGDVPVSSDNCPVYRPSQFDIGHQLRCAYTPVRDDGVEGTTVEVSTSGPIPACEPTIKNLQLLGGPFIQNDIEVAYDYLGGKENGTVIEWSVKRPGALVFEKLDSLKGKRSYKPCADDLGATFRVTVNQLQSNEVELFMDPEVAIQIGKHYEKAEATMAITLDGQSVMITCTQKKVLIGTNEKALHKEAWSKEMSIVCVDATSIELFLNKKKKLTIQVESQQSRDYVVQVFRAFWALGEKAMNKATNIDKAAVKDFKSKDDKRRSTVVESLERAGSSVDLMKIEDLQQRMVAVVVEAIRGNTKNMQSKLGRLRIERELKQEKVQEKLAAARKELDRFDCGDEVRSRWQQEHAAPRAEAC